MASHEPKDEKAEPFGLYCVVVDAGEGGLASAATPSLATSTCHSVFGAHPATRRGIEEDSTHPLMVNLGSYHTDTPPGYLRTETGLSLQISEIILIAARQNG